MNGLAFLLIVPMLAASGQGDFQNPPTRYGPSAFWWWFVGATYTQTDVQAAMADAKAAGMGGLRITPVYSFPGAPSGGPTYLSSGYLDLVRAAVDAARGNGMVLDSLLGTGWPYGGPYIPPSMGAAQLKHYVQELRGPGVFEGPIPGRLGPGESLLAVQALPSSATDGVDLDGLIDLTGQVLDGRMTPWRIPPGRWLLITFVAGRTGMKVKRAAPGGEGLVLDHFQREALDLHLRHNGDRQAPALRGAESVTMDSWEVFGANWTPGLPGAFQKRRGYRLEPYLAALFYPAGAQGPRVRYDFRRTISELALENFFTPLRDWAHDHGFRTRVEAHGTPADTIEAYGRNDVPEAETYGPPEHAGLRIRDRRLAASAAHLFDRRQISCETFTWLRYPMFQATLQDMKAAADDSYLDGVNQVNFHGVPFSPKNAAAPGFYFYASTFVAPANPWWPYLPHLTSYLRRANYQLQQGEPVTDVALYLPIEDIWGSAMGDWYDLAGATEAHLRQSGAVDLLNALLRGGYQFDLINGPQLEAGAAGRYRAVILPDLASVEPAVLRKLVEYQNGGGVVLASGSLPIHAPGLENAAARNHEVLALSAQLFPQGSDRSFPRYAAQVLDPGHHPLVTRLARQVAPDVASDQLGPDIGFVHRRDARQDVYFLVNRGLAEVRFQGSFRTQYESPYVLDPETGATTPAFEHRREEGRTVVSLHLRSGQSLFVAFRSDPMPSVTAHNVDRVLVVSASGATVEVSGNGSYFAEIEGRRLTGHAAGVPAPLAIAGPWSLSASGAATATLSGLRSWTELPGFAGFSGTATYRAELNLPADWRQPGQRLVLALEEVHEVAEALIDGRSAGVAWKAPYRIALPDIAPGTHILEIRVTNLLFNQMLAASSPPPPYVPLTTHPHPLPSGLMGRVTIQPVRTINLAP
ncbi:MAG: hypothetical protein J0H49_09535 [Acidobacteria bacterium]|nr:hypothetical protein [Acidobacteriota bacterium]